MRVRRSAVWFAVLMTVAAPEMLPAGWSDAAAKRSRAKIEKSRRAPPAKPKPERVSDQAPASPKNTSAEPPRAAYTWPLTLGLSTAQASYKAGDLLTVTAVADAACDLTLISIDADGFAVVLFPNEFEPNNQLLAGVPVTIPSANAAYQLRVKTPGTEIVLGICSPPGTRPRGIAADYERYRFTLLGPWTEFAETIPKREEEIVKAAAEYQRKRSRRGGDVPPLAPPSDSSSQGRSVLLIPVEPGA